MTPQDRTPAVKLQHRLLPQTFRMPSAILLTLFLSVPALAHDSAVPHVHVNAQQGVTLFPLIFVLATIASLLVAGGIAYRRMTISNTATEQRNH